MKMIIEELMYHFHRVTYLNFKRDFMEIMPQLPPLKFQRMPLFGLFVCLFLSLKMHKRHHVHHAEYALIIFIWPLL